MIPRIINIFLIIQLIDLAKSAAIVGSSLAFAHPCNGSQIITEIFESDQPPEDENKYKLLIHVNEFDKDGLREQSKIKMTFDSETNVTLDSVPARITTREDFQFEIRFYRDFNKTVAMTVRGKRGKPVPNVINVLINEDDICPNGYWTGIWDNLIVGDVNSAVIKEKIPNNKYKCGKKIITHNELITNGQDTKPGDWPWHVAIYKIHVSKSTQTYICGGSLINPTYILTAGHCVVENGVKINPKRLFAALGKYNLAGGDIGSQEKSVFKIILHPDFDAKTLSNDISLLELSSEVTYGQYVQPICLWESDKVAKSNIYENLGTVVGWGFTQNNEISQQLIQGTMPVVSDLTCLRSYPTHFEKYLNDNTYCAGFRNGTSVCNGDSGGGMYFSRIEDETVVWFIRGIVSLSVRKSNENVCDPDYFVVFTDVARYLYWIETNMK